MSLIDLMKFIDMAAGSIQAMQVSRKQFDRWYFEAHAKYCWGPTPVDPSHMIQINGVVITPDQDSRIPRDASRRRP